MTFLLCGLGWCVHKSDDRNKWDDNTHSSRLKTTQLICVCFESAPSGAPEIVMVISMVLKVALATQKKTCNPIHVPCAYGRIKFDKLDANRVWLPDV